MKLSSFGSAVAALTLWTSDGAAQPPVMMNSIAPTNSFFVAEIPTMAGLQAAAEGSALGDLWRDDRFRAFFDRALEDGLKELNEQLAQIEAKAEDLKPPTGRVGVALFMNEDPTAVPPFHALLVADFGEHADDWRALIARAVDEGKNGEDVEITEEDREGIIVTTIRPLDVGEDPEAEEPAEPQDFWFAWSGSNLAFATHRGALDGALDALAGREIDAIGEDEVFERSLRQHGDNPLAWGVLLFAPLAESFREFAQNAPVPMDPGEMLEALGLSGVQSMGMALASVGGNESLAETTVAVLAPEKTGLLALFTEPLGAFEPSPFVGPDTASLTAFNFRFDGLIEVLRGAVNAMPAEQRESVLPMFEQGAAMFAPALNNLGPRVQFFSSYERPLTAESQRQVFAVQVRDPLPVSNTLATFAPQLGLETRPFEGNTIYSGEFFPVSMGIGFGTLFIGPTAAVENAMRLASNPDAPRLAGEAHFRAATAGLSPQAVISAFADLRQEIQWAYHMFQNIEAMQEEAIRDADIPEEEREEFLRAMREENPVPAWIEHLPPIEVFTERLGFSVYDLRATPDGFLGRSLLLKPE